ncbi:MAG: 4Fe-4S binding protein [Phycisphaerae bacterium]
MKPPPRLTTTILFTLLVLPASTGVAQLRFPTPELDEPLPETTTPEPREQLWQYSEYVDVAVLALALAAAAWFALKKRSRRGMAVVMLLSLLYFGFYRLGCVCAVGSVQNCALSFGDAGYAAGWAVVAFFLLPLFAALLFGRVFCGGVCPLGAIQDIVAIKPLKVPRWLESGLSLLAVTYLGAAVVLAFSGSVFLICRFDPFVSIFRLAPVGKWMENVARGDLSGADWFVTGRTGLLVLGGAILLLGVFVARPYCRFLCPYGVLLRPLSRLSRWHLTITPDECVQCRLCENSCPFGAILPSSPPDPGRSAGKVSLVVSLAVWPVLIAAGAGAGRLAGPVISRADYSVRLAEHLRSGEARQLEDTQDMAEAFASQPVDAEEVFAAARRTQAKFVWGAMVVGGFVGLVAGMRLVRWSVRRRRNDYTPDTGTCLSCGRCVETCPVEHLRRLGQDRALWEQA